MPFLQQIAQDLQNTYGNNLSQITVIFPNKRARLFLNEHLCQAAETPVWSPVYGSLDELFRCVTPLQTADPLKLIAELYHVYTAVFARHNPQAEPETFDEFYFFGEMLLNDFNDIDKNLVNETALFANLADLDALKDDFEHLDERQWAAINRFFRDIATNRTALKEAFYSVWSILGEVYREFKQRLRTENLAYDGMLFRDAVENLQASGIGNHFPQEKYIFIGFNVLTACEKALFKILRQNEKAIFYWDFPAEKNNVFPAEVDFFMPENIRQFGNEFTENTDMQQGKKITLIAAPSESAQAGFVSQWIDNLQLPNGFDKPDSAIVLCNEQNLQAVMHAIPPAAGKVNITMGFPLTQTPVYSLLTALAELQLKGADGRVFRYNYVLPVLRNPYVRLVFPAAAAVQKRMTDEHNFFPTHDDLQHELIFSHTKNAAEMAVYLLEIVKTVAVAHGKKNKKENDDDTFSDLYSEALFRAYQILTRLKDLLQSGELQMEKMTFVALLKRLLALSSVPFHGEPVEGLQVMGVLETRNMDFDNLLIMSMNEGVMPKTDSESSFIPHFIRKFFGMPTIEHQDALYAYYFYRLLQRANNVASMYNTANQQAGKAEISRFLLQLLAESNYEIEHVSLQSEIKPLNSMPISVPKTPDLMTRMREKYDQNFSSEARRLSPSALNNYLDCSLRFYLQYIEGVRSPKELTDELDNSLLGSVFHKAMELIYKEIGHIPSDQKTFAAFKVEAEQIDSFLRNENRIENAIEQAFNVEFFKREMPRDRYNGEQLIYLRIVKQFVKRLLRLDKIYAPFEIVALEHEVARDLIINYIRLNVGGIIDRIDRKDGVVRVVDYKTGGANKDFDLAEKLFEQSKDRPKHQFQAFLYASIVAPKQSEAVVPALIYLQKATDETYSSVCSWEKTPISDFREHVQAYNDLLQASLQELFNPAVPFCQTSVEKNCDYCDFKGICGKD